MAKVDFKAFLEISIEFLMQTAESSDLMMSCWEEPLGMLGMRKEDFKGVSRSNKAKYRRYTELNFLTRA